VEGVVHQMDLQELGERIEALTEKVESLRRFL
jgi:polyhydroxyalkanoate synthesis regulator phasin